MNALEIASKNHTPIRLVNQILDLLVDIKVVAEIYTPGEVVKIYQPALDINAITVQLLLEKIEKHGSENFKIDHYSKEFEAIWKNLQEWKEKDIIPYSILIKDL